MTVVLQPCEACGHEVSPAATACPACGHPATAAAARVDNSFAWALVAIPLLTAVVAVTLYMLKIDASQDWFWLASIGVVAAVALLDERRLRSQGIRISGLGAALLVPFYLIDRSRKAKQTYALPVAWVIAAVVGYGGSVAADRYMGPVDLNMPGIEIYLQQQLDSAYSTSTTVTCPEQQRWWVHDEFVCQATDSSGEVPVRVTLTDRDGGLTWLPETS